MTRTNPSGRACGALTFESAVLPYQPALVAWARHITANPEDAQDLAQETLVRAFARFSTFRGDRNGVPPWLRAILRNESINAWRRRQQQPDAFGWDGATAGDDPLLADRAPSPEAQTLRRAEAAALLRAVANLPDMYRAPLLLADLEGMPYRAIAERLGMPLNTVRSRIHRGREKVQRALAGWRPAETARP